MSSGDINTEGPLRVDKLLLFVRPLGELSSCELFRDSVGERLRHFY